MNRSDREGKKCKAHREVQRTGYCAIYKNYFYIGRQDEICHQSMPRRQTCVIASEGLSSLIALLLPVSVPCPSLPGQGSDADRCSGLVMPQCCLESNTVRTFLKLMSALQLVNILTDLYVVFMHSSYSTLLVPGID